MRRGDAEAPTPGIPGGGLLRGRRRLSPSRRGKQGRGCSWGGGGGWAAETDRRTERRTPPRSPPPASLHMLMRFRRGARGARVLIKSAGREAGFESAGWESPVPADGKNLLKWYFHNDLLLYVVR